MRSIERVLVVEDNPRLLATLQHALARRFADVRGCRSVRAVRTLLASRRPELLVVDYALPDGDARTVLDLAEAWGPAPVVIAISAEAGPVETFALAQRGVRAFLPKPLTLAELERAIDRSLTTAPPLQPHVRQLVGHRALAEVTQEVRDVMVDEALAQTNRSRRSAARVLGTSRQLIQYLLRRR